MDTATNLLNVIPAGAVWTLLAAIVVSLALQFFKKWLAVQSDKVITFMLMCFSFIPAALDYLNSQVAVNPTVLGQRTFLIMGAATTVYRYLIKPASTLIEDAKQYRSGVVPTEPSHQLDTIHMSMEETEAPDAPATEFVG